MTKKRTRDERSESRARARSGAKAPAEPPEERESAAPGLIELRPGLFLNEDHIVSIRVLPEEDRSAYAVMHLSNGDKLSLTPEEFRMLTGTDPRPPARMRATYRAGP